MFLIAHVIKLASEIFLLDLPVSVGLSVVPSERERGPFLGQTY